MAGLINTSSIYSLLWPGLKAVFSDYETYKPQYLDIFKVHESDKNYERDVEMRTLGAAQLKPEGQAMQYGNMGQMFEYWYQNSTYAQGYIITEEAISDSQYKSDFPNQNLDLKNALAETRNINAASVLNNGFNPLFSGGDGQPLFSTVHPIQGGTIANTFSIPTQLNETSLGNAITAIANFRNAAGLRMNYETKKLVIPQSLWQTAKALVGSKFTPTSANNAINTVFDGVLPEGYAINNFLVGNAWYITTDCPNSLKMYQRQKMRVDCITDQDTNSLKVRAFERYCFGWSNFRGIFGSQGI